ncbi:DUF4133 domain-containing protein [Rudanella paleaurantiibacter]|uniref:DUF4133 domain-containing protein n=1 Tax=Rudanella paleaurantiibacter TaxID=2614655 RepID=A0A7J5TTJ8_9BACT|nr:DUF4133 domain-containing protein [Rudanella paleaurantiibacter]KAB7726671.1 DUF4133 domain-containing protein [Rudanella paleaurantiibacter]
MFKVNKGIDRPPEVLGIRGMDFIYYLAGAAVGLLLVTCVLMFLFGIPAKIAFGGYILVLLVLYTLFARLSQQYGERGINKQRGRKQQPGVVLVRDSAVYRQLRKTTARRA